MPTRVRTPSPANELLGYSDEKTCNCNQNYSKHVHILFGNGEDFFKWIDLQQYSKDHIAHLKSYFKKHFKNKAFASPFNLQESIYKNKTGLGSIILTARVYLKFCEQIEKLPESTILKYRKVLKITKSRKDFFVPSNEEVISNYNKIKNTPNYKIVYLILATSGIRYVECLNFLKNYDEKKFKIHYNLVSYNVSDLRHTKNINNIYLPLFVYEKLQRVTNTYNSLRQKYKKKGLTFSLKYLRKWHYNFLLYKNVPESVADFIQGRASRSISSRHYLAKSQQAEFWYAKLIPVFEAIFHNNNIPRKGDEVGRHTIIMPNIQRTNYSEVEK